MQIAIAGAGKIACEEHIPAIRENPFFALCALSHCTEGGQSAPGYASVDAMLDAHPEIDAVAVCTPPQARYESAKLALDRGKHVLLEKPPCPAVSQLEELVAMAKTRGLTIFQTWHARHAAGVDAAEAWLKSRHIRRGRIVWKEDVGRWHPGQSWLWRRGGFGVFDAGINALSILTKIAPGQTVAKKADLYFPGNCETPIAAHVELETCDGAAIEAEFDFRYSNHTAWDIQIETDDGILDLEAYGRRLAINGRAVPLGEAVAEYPALYRRFAALIGEERLEVDKSPLQLVADIFLVARNHSVEPFHGPAMPVFLSKLSD